MLESQIEKKVCDAAKKMGFWCRKFVSVNCRGVPDRIFAIDGRVFWIEFKRPGQKPTELQQIEHTRMRQNGLRVYVCDNVDYGKSILERERDAASL